MHSKSMTNPSVPLASQKYRKYYQLLPDRTLNSYPPAACGGIAETQYQPGDFVVHFAGCWMPQRYVSFV